MLSCRPQLPPARLVWFFTASIAYLISPRKSLAMPDCTIVVFKVMLFAVTPESVAPPFLPGAQLKPATGGSAAPGCGAWPDRSPGTGVAETCVPGRGAAEGPAVAPGCTAPVGSPCASELAEEPTSWLVGMTETVDITPRSKPAAKMGR